VLGGAAYDDGTLDYNSYLRAINAVWAYREGGFHTVILSGGKAGSSIPLAEGMRMVLLWGGVPASTIRVEDRSLTTHENPYVPCAPRLQTGGAGCQSAPCFGCSYANWRMVQPRDALRRSTAGNGQNWL